jgi:hypothetical protein
LDLDDRIDSTTLHTLEVAIEEPHHLRDERGPAHLVGLLLPCGTLPSADVIELTEPRTLVGSREQVEEVESSVGFRVGLEETLRQEQRSP